MFVVTQSSCKGLFFEFYVIVYPLSSLIKSVETCNLLLSNVCLLLLPFLKYSFISVIEAISTHVVNGPSRGN